MGRYFKVVEITQFDFVNKVGDDISGPWCQIVSPRMTVAILPPVTGNPK